MVKQHPHNNRKFFGTKIRGRDPIVFSLALLALLFQAVSCKKKHPDETTTPDKLQNGILVLNEGLFNLNNSSLSWINLSASTVDDNFFEEKTGRGLGDTGNDLQRYGNKLYIVVNVSSTLEILDATTGQSLHQASMISGSTPQQPRSIAFWQNKALVSCYDGFVSVFDTATYALVTRIQVGSNPEGLAVSNNKLFVANSGGLNTIMDSTVSVVDLTTMQETGRINVGLNPGGVCVDNQGDVYVVTRGNYANIPSRMHKIDPNTLAVTDFGFDAGGMTLMNNNLLISYFDFGSQSSSIGLFNTITETLTSSGYLSTAGIQTLYGVHYSPATNRIYLCDAKGYTETGSVLIYSANGTFLSSFNAGLNPSELVIYE